MCDEIFNKQQKLINVLLYFTKQKMLYNCIINKLSFHSSEFEFTLHLCYRGGLYHKLYVYIFIRLYCIYNIIYNIIFKKLFRLCDSVDK